MMVCAAAQAATINTTLTVNAVATIGATISVTGTATLTGIGNGTLSGTLSLTPDASGNLSAPFTITLTTGGPGTINITVKVPFSALVGGGPVTGSATVTGGTGNFAGATGSFPSLTGTGALGASGATITLTVTGAGTILTGGDAGPPTPTVTAVLDGASLTKNVAQGSIFVVEGSNLAPSGFVQSGFPLPTILNSVKITLTPTAGGAGTDAYVIYTCNTATFNCAGDKSLLAAVLPSSVATGNYNLTVTINGVATAPFAATVVQRKPGLFTQDSSGSGLAVVQNFISGAQLDVNRFTTGTISGITISPARPGQTLIAWATGLGPVTTGDNTAAPLFNFAANGVNVQVIVGGVSIAASFAGRAPGLAAEDQINFQLPANVPTGCTVSFQVSVNGVLSNPAFIAIAPDANATACVFPGFTTAQLQQFDNGASRTFGSFSLSQFSISEASLGTVKIDSASGGFRRYTGFQLAGLAQVQAQFTSSGACTVSHTVSSSSGQAGLTPVAPGNLDAGAVTLNGPAGSGLTNQAFTEDPTSKQYSINLGTEGIGLPGGLNAKLIAGQYTVAGAGGADVGNFNAQITLGAPLTLTADLPGSVNRSAGLTLNWTGGNASDLVRIFGISSTSTGTGTSAIVDSWTFICTTNAGAGTFTVPSSILLQLPAVSAQSTTGSGILEFASGVNPATFTAPLTAGGSIDSGLFLSSVGFGALVAYQ